MKTKPTQDLEKDVQELTNIVQSLMVSEITTAKKVDSIEKMLRQILEVAKKQSYSPVEEMKPFNPTKETK